ncbi:MAG: hypothetical protein U0237_16400 [Thermoleophilia bacterium]
MAADLEDRLARLGDAAAPDDGATARARAAALEALPAGRRRRSWRHLLPRRRTMSVAFAVAGTVAIAGVLVLSLPRGADRPVPAGITLVATAPSPGGVVDAADLETTAQMIDRRARIMRIDGADAEVVDGDIVLHLPDDAPPGALRDLTARGEFAIYDGMRVIGPANGSRRRPLPGPGQHVIDVPDGKAGTVLHILVAGSPALTNADVAAVKPDVVFGDQPPFLEIRLTTAGRRAFHRLTQRIAQRGAVERRVGTTMLVIDGELVSRPTIDPEEFPDGLNSPAVEIDGHYSPADPWRRIAAAKIEEGPLPVVLAPAG